MPLQIPPAVGSSGQFVETVIVTSSQQRHIMVLGDGVSTAYGPVTSSGGVLVTLSSGAILLSSNSVTQVIVSGTSGGFGVVTSAGSLQVITTASATSTAPRVVQWTSSGAYTTVISSGQLSGLTTGTGVLSTLPITNNKDQYAHYELQVTATGAFSAGDFFSVYFLVAADHTNFEDGSASITPARAPDLIIPVRAVTNTSQRINMKHVPLPPGTFTHLIVNNANDPTSTGTNILSYRPYNEQII